jgi:hypothetical protein
VIASLEGLTGEVRNGGYIKSRAKTRKARFLTVKTWLDRKLMYAGVYERWTVVLFPDW